HRIPHALLARDPRDELADALCKGHARTVAEQALDAREVGVAVADVAGAELLGDLEAAAPAELAGERLRDLEHAQRAAAADVEDLVIGGRRFHRQPAGLDDVADVDEVPPLPAILEDQRSPAVEEAAGENRRH